MSNTALWVKSFLDSGSRSERLLQRQSLFQYRCVDAEYESLRASLRRDLSDCPLADQRARHFFPAFVFYAAEWFRREFGRGQWAWDPLLESIGVPEGKRNDIHGRVDSMEEAFQKFWGRPVTRHAGQRRLLWTAVREGGLPLRRLAESRDQERFANLLMMLLEACWRHPGTDLLGLAREEMGELPQLLQNDTILINLCLLADLLAPFHEHLAAGQGASLLERPGFASQLPFMLDDAVARSVANKMIAAGQSVAAKLKTGRVTFELCLIPRGESFCLRGHLSLPRRLKPTDLGLSGEPSGGRLYLQTAGGERYPLGDFEVASDGALSLRPKQNPFLVPAASNTGALSLVSIAAKKELGRSQLFAPSALPWVFREKDDQWSFIGAGSRRTKAAKVRVLALPGFSAAGHFTRMLETHVAGRALFEVSGQAAFESDADQCTITTGSEVDDDVEYFLSGSRSNLAEAAWQGSPSLMRAGGALRQAVSGAEWRPDGQSSRPLRAESTGTGWIVLRAGKETLFRERATLLPVGARVRAERTTSNRMQLRFEGFGDVVVTDPNGRKGDSGVVSVFSEPVGKLIDFVVAWRDGTSARLSHPVPGEALLFRAADGAVWLGDRRVTLRSLRGATAEAFGRSDHRYEVEVRQLDAKGTPWAVCYELEQSGAEHRLVLDLLEEDVRTAFARTTDHEVVIALTLRTRQGFDRTTRRLEVVRYGSTLVPLRARKRLELRDADGSITMDGSITIKAQPMDQPGTPGFPLLALEPGAWTLADERLTRGPWLLTAWDGSVRRHRPLLYTVHEGSEAPPNRLLAEAVRGRDGAVRKRQFDEAFSALEHDLNHPEWCALEGFLATLDDLPPQTYEVLTNMIGRPVLCALALLRCDSNEARLRLLTGLECLPFMWHLLPLSAWVRALQADLVHRQAVRPANQKVNPLNAISAAAAAIARISPIHSALAQVIERACIDLRLCPERMPPPDQATSLKAASDAWLKFLSRQQQHFEGQLLLERQALRLPPGLLPLLELPVAVSNVAPEGSSVDYRSLYLAPRIAAALALSGAAHTDDLVLLLRFARGHGQAQSEHFNETYRLCLEAMLADNKISQWKAPS